MSNAYEELLNLEAMTQILKDFLATGFKNYASSEIALLEEHFATMNQTVTDIRSGFLRIQEDLFEQFSTYIFNQIDYFISIMDFNLALTYLTVIGNYLDTFESSKSTFVTQKVRQQLDDYIRTLLPQTKEIAQDIIFNTTSPTKIKEVADIVKFMINFVGKSHNYLNLKSELVEIYQMLESFY